MLPLPKRRRTNRKGSLLIDALLAVAIFGAIIVAFSSGIMQGQLGTVEGSNRIRALYLAEEGLEAVRWIRDEESGGVNVGYDKLFGSTPGYALGTPHGVKLISGEWAMQDSSPTLIDGVFTRSIIFTAGSDDDERLVQSVVTWDGLKGLGGQQTIATSILTNWQSNPVPISDWSRPVLVGTFAYPFDSFEKIAIGGPQGTGAYIVGSAPFATSSGLYLFDISDPTAPELEDTAKVNDPGASARSYNIALSGNYAYVTSTDNGGKKVKIVDISADQLVWGGNGILTGNNSIHQGIAASGGHLYVSTMVNMGGAEFYIYDIGSNPTNPPKLGEFDANPLLGTLSMYDIAPEGASGTGVYIAASMDGELVLLDVGNAASPHYETGMNLAGTLQSYSVALAGDSLTGAFLGRTGQSGSYDVFSSDVSEQTTPIPESSHVDLNGRPVETTYDIAVSQNNYTGLLATNMKVDTATHACLPKATKHYLITMDFSSVHNIESPSRMLYKGVCSLADPPNDCLIQANEFCTECTYDPLLGCNEMGKGIAFNESLQTIYLVTGSTTSSNLLIFQPTYVWQ